MKRTTINKNDGSQNKTLPIYDFFIIMLLREILTAIFTKTNFYLLIKEPMLYLFFILGIFVSVIS